MFDHTPKQETAATVAGLRADDRVLWAREVPWTDNKLPGAIPMRLQLIRVIRGDTPVTFRKLLGPEQFFGSPFNFYGGLEYSAGEVVTEIAPWLREGKPEQAERPDMLQRWREAEEEKRALAAHRTVIGPHLTVQRN